MSEALLASVVQFLRDRSDPQTFADDYITAWKKERDSNALLADDPVKSEVLSSVFCLADLFNGNAERESYEFDENGLRERVAELLENASMPWQK